jgi:hypothetical protein
MPDADLTSVRMLPQRYEPLVPLDQLHPHPANFNDPDLGLLCTLLEANGFAGAVLAQESTGILFDGRTRLEAAREKGLPGLPVIWVDVDDDTRDRLLGEWNESCRAGRHDEARLVAFLQGMVTTADGLAGCAFTGDQLDAAIRRLQAQAADGGPPPADGWTVTVHLPDDGAAADEFFALIGAERARTVHWRPA